MTEQNPFKHFGVVDLKLAASDSGLEFLQKVLDGTYPAPPFGEVAGMWPISFERGKVVFVGFPTPRFYNPMGIVHGGWVSTMLDSAMGCAVHSMLKPGQGYATIAMNVNFVRTVSEKTGRVQCEGSIVHFGGRMATSEGRVTDGDGKLIAHGSETCMVFDFSRPA
jgi:uncharacterized protein (TIGR00369 family)